MSSDIWDEGSRAVNSAKPHHDRCPNASWFPRWDPRPRKPFSFIVGDAEDRAFPPVGHFVFSEEIGWKSVVEAAKFRGGDSTGKRGHNRTVERLTAHEHAAGPYIANGV